MRLNAGFCAFECDFDLLVEQFVSWQRQVLRSCGAGADFKRVEGRIGKLIERLDPPVRPVPTKNLFLKSSSEWVIGLDNGYRGTDGGMAPVMSGMLACRTVRVVSQPDIRIHGKRVKYGTQILEVYRNGEYERTLYCANDGGRWTFDQSGSPYPFEDVSRYGVRRIADRFRREDLLQCLEHLSLRPFDSKWFELANASCFGAIVVRTGSYPRNYTEMSENTGESSLFGRLKAVCDWFGRH